MKEAWKITFSVLCGLLGAGVILLVSQTRRGPAVTLLPPPTAAPILVDVAGAVNSPGVYALPADSRVQDAIQAAGGLMPEADTQALNLAARLQDGGKVIIPARPMELLTSDPGNPAPTDSRLFPLSLPTASQLININTASQIELETLPGIGPVIALRIIEYRQVHGPFQTIEDLLDVDGIGQKTFDQFKHLITV